MNIAVFHRLLIATAIAFDVFFTVFCIRKYNRNGDAWELIMGIASSLVTLAFVAYLFHFDKKARQVRLYMAAQDRLCPKCNYDLQGSLDSTVNACPECGCEITDEFRKLASKATQQPV